MSLAKRFAILGIFALLALQLLWHAWLLPAQSIPAMLMLGFMIVPITPAVVLVLFKKPSALFWAGVASLFYFCHSITEIWLGTESLALAWLELFLSLWIIFTSNWQGLQAKLFKRKST